MTRGKAGDTGVFEKYFEVEAVLWARASRRCLDRALAIPASDDPNEIVERYGELCLALIAFDHVLRVVDAHLRTSRAVHPIGGAARALAKRVSRLRNLVDHEDKEIHRGLLVRIEGDLLVGRQGRTVFELSFDEWRRALDQLEEWGAR